MFELFPISSRGRHEKDVFEVCKEPFVGSAESHRPDIIEHSPGKNRTYRAPGNAACEHRHILNGSGEKRSSGEVTGARTKCGCAEHQR